MVTICSGIAEFSLNTLLDISTSSLNFLESNFIGLSSNITNSVLCCICKTSFAISEITFIGSTIFPILAKSKLASCALFRLKLKTSSGISSFRFLKAKGGCFCRSFNSASCVGVNSPFLFLLKLSICLATPRPSESTTSLYVLVTSSSIKIPGLIDSMVNLPAYLSLLMFWLITFSVKLLLPLVR